MDIPVLAFIENILGVYPAHTFFQFTNISESLRIAALASLGIQNKRLVVLFNKNQPTVSMTVKRHSERAGTMQIAQRYDKQPTYTLVQKPFQSKFTKAGGQS